MFRTGKVRIIEKSFRKENGLNNYTLFYPQFEVKLWFMKPFWVHYKRLEIPFNTRFFCDTLKECEEWLCYEPDKDIVHKYNGKVTR